MKLNNSKRSLLSVHLISCIIINFLKLRELYSSVKSSKLISKMAFLKDISNFGYDVLSLNIISIILNFYPYYKKCSKIINYVNEKIKNLKGT